MPVRNDILPLSIFIAVAAILAVVRATTHPSLTRAWEPNQAILATIETHGDDVSIRNIRNTQYRSAGDYVPTYYDRTFKLSEVKSACLVKEELEGFGNAHLMITFEFPGPEWILFSPEPRLERGESFFAFLGLLRRYELAYMVTSESDAIYFATKILNHPVHLYELRLGGEKLRALFTSMTERESALAQEPEFYHTIFNSVSSNILRHLRPLAAKHVPGPLILPSNADRLAYEMKILRRGISFELLSGNGMITDVARECEPDSNFSEKIHTPVSQIQEGV